MHKAILISAALCGSASVAHATIDWNGDTSKNSQGYDTWIIAEATYAATSPVIDGVVETGEWDDAARNPLETVLFLAPEGTTTAQFAVKWDENNIYVLVEAADSVGMTTTGHKFELYISTAYTRRFGAWQNPGYGPEDRQVVCSINPLSTDFTPGLYGRTSAMPSFVRANSVAGSSYVSEVKIAWSDLGGLPSDNGYVNSDYIGFEVHTQRNGPDPAKPNTDRTKLAWAGVADTAWAATEDWGTLRLLPSGSSTTDWAGYPVQSGNWIDTAGLLGWLNVGISPWIYSDTLGRFVFMKPSYVSQEGAWAWVSR